MKKRYGIITVCGAMTVVLVLLLGGNFMMTQDSVKRESGGLLPPPVPIISVIAGKQVSSIQEANNVAGYHANLPTYLPSGYKIQVINADVQSGTTTLLASQEPVTSKTTDNEFFMQQNGILIFIQKNTAGFDASKWLSKWSSERSAVTVDINGISGAVHGITVVNTSDGETIKAPAELVFVKNNVLTEIRGMIPTDELIKIAKTL